jgi:hypothetical protein
MSAACLRLIGRLTHFCVALSHDGFGSMELETGSSFSQNDINTKKALFVEIAAKQGISVMFSLRTCGGGVHQSDQVRAILARRHPTTSQRGDAFLRHMRHSQ